MLLPGVTTLARLVARVREEATARLQQVLAGLLTERQRRLLDLLLEVEAGARVVSDLERWRKAPLKGSGPGMIKALDRVAEITGLGLGAVDLDAVVPHRRVAELARYGMAAKAAQLRRHGDARRLATLLATVTYLEAKAVDDALELLDLLMVTELVGRAERQAGKERARRHPGWPGPRPGSPPRWRSCWTLPDGARRSAWRRCGRRSTRWCPAPS